MANAQLAIVLRKLSSHLRPDVGKMLGACATALANTSGDCTEAIQKVVGQYRTKKQRETLQQSAELLVLLGSLGSTEGNSQDKFSAIAAVLTHAAAGQVRKPTRPSVGATNNVDLDEANRLAAQLADARLDRDRFSRLVQKLEDGKRVNTPTLHRIADSFLGNCRTYKGRKQAIEAIRRRHHDALRIAAQDQMLDRLE